MTPADFDAMLTIARKHNVEEFSDGVLAVKFAPAAGPPLTEKKEQPEPLSQLDLVNMQLGPDTDSVSLPPTFGADGAAQETSSPTNVGWATDDPAKEK